MDFRGILLEMIHSVDGSIASSFCGIDGIGVETVVLDKDIDANEAEVEISTMLKVIGEIANNLQAGNIRSFIFEAEKFNGLLEKCGNDYFICILLKPESNIGKARYVLRKYAKMIEKEI
ncbi:MAG: hypothetical protein B6D57_02445 [Candidatus Coatesbacteria bacterium 4484_99]|uniref:Roadblock/LAMTOR2 domain-containing protein n=1 Tax=Candidatus Coatesbacteria bacterium 4484_99 TaxID=1970774 RepID=A0A1W9S1G5_9BACT|nr:MAG: hypothetical protein B6D57_02445 [Candidatus Coatesbacteria bacterium 4484_99]RLC44302.1 MAG: hypothetical protein DRH44_02800 [Candidatus Coatesbacteria bacterium]